MVILPLLLGVMVYWLFRSGPTRYEEWIGWEKKIGLPGRLSNWLPDYCWCVSLLSFFTVLWDGWDRVPRSWKWILWILVTGTELLQYLHVMEGVGDWIDILMYQLAFLTVYTLHKTQRL
jgi:hypothetical protein